MGQALIRVSHKNYKDSARPIVACSRKGLKNSPDDLALF